ncbi:NtaA/DmoA family FMN-dependent monooxygenase [Stutzerimonas kirkiae]|uniref:FMN-dependent monooxygenase n=1 Tax=Stutzerimonas kirkiae TaxID=2211392 RepID=A0A4Q9QWL2_9GAMM|nr:NtaA/DmoA family FMN-dependent monooxygenase [Stutzerimonas kirkiae]TBU88676.1 FMN-dependent monooxygenase [Stutzerimonas kirkiae]TBU98504.1 FMN-dependent monooxygenase [Stutzerimonas kirkiae]TBV02581.1 FMN-dependent monooxygenase [Stutzerimonas kirkiae]
MSHLHLGLLFNSPGNDPAAPQRPSDLGYYAETTRLLERARFDFVMVADVAFQDRVHPQPPRPEPITLFSALAALTSHIGLVPTLSTSFTAPFNLARQVLSLDNLSAGRAAWNVVTSSAGADNFGDTPLPPHSERYRRALEHVEVVRKLWDSWEDDAIIQQPGQRPCADPARVHPIDHRGEFYQVAGPLNAARSPQGHPVLFQAGSSEDGKAFAAHFAEAIYTAQHHIPEARRFRDDVHAQARRLGRNPAHIKILPGLSTVIGESDAAARQLNERILEGFGSDIWAALKAQLGGIELGDLDLDRPLPLERLPEVLSIEGRQSRYALFRQFAVQQRWPLRQLLELQGGSAGHGRVVGSPEQVAGHIEQWFRQGASDGFIVMPGQGADGARLFAEQVVPILQKRGLFRRDYASDTLRGHLGLPIPHSRYAAPLERAIR